MGCSARGIVRHRVYVTFPWGFCPSGVASNIREVWGAQSDEKAIEHAIAGTRYQYGLLDDAVVTAAILR